MLKGCSRIVAFALLLAFSVQLLASVQPPCAMVPASSIPAIETKAIEAIAIVTTAAMVEDHVSMKHAAMIHTEQQSVSQVQSAHQMMPHGVNMTMDCCEPEGQCNMDLCLLAPAMLSQFHWSGALGALVQSPLVSSMAVLNSATRLYHPPRLV